MCILYVHKRYTEQSKWMPSFQYSLIETRDRCIHRATQKERKRGNTRSKGDCVLKTKKKSICWYQCVPMNTHKLKRIPNEYM